MKMVRIAGVLSTLQCIACGTTGTGGTEPYKSAASGKMIAPEDWYVTDENIGPYCASCSIKIVKSEDTTRSVTQFYATVTGLMPPVVRLL